MEDLKENNIRMRNHMMPEMRQHALPFAQNSFLAQLNNRPRRPAAIASRKSAFKNVSMVSQEFFNQRPPTGSSGIPVKVARLESMDSTMSGLVQ